ncbi:hypothetical protein JAAARDRAFT_38329 [Jaapia argillacea MUCL 33604]|uniref:Uncharacterized protein n=1 Tax=Jaapia argillacea MUCL 33604 TaxID=933084 RepID=A0A067PLE0_9AGAM|nr:hypothetical protein JAAARDRAFT_38329 [Jaapia argillacea MUCL 33604]
MVIVDEKSMRLPPPPPYWATGPAVPPPFPSSTPREPPKLDTLPPHILLQIVWATFPKTAGFDEGKVERQRKTLYWLSIGLRLVNRGFYIACMNVLRSTYLPAYQSLIRPPYSSDPFPFTSQPSSSSPYSSAYVPSSPPNAPSSPICSVQRETSVLDLFIALKVREDVWADDSELHLERDESFKDLFDLMQPKSRCEDLLRVYGVREGVISVSDSNFSSSSASTSNAAASSSSRSSSSRTPTPSRKTPAIKPLPFSALSISFSTRKIGLILSSRGGKRTIVEVQRSGRDEKLEVATKKLVRELKGWLGGSYV